MRSLEKELYPKFFIRFPGKQSIHSYQGIKSAVEETSSLNEEAIVTAPFDQTEIGSTPICWIPKEKLILESYHELYPLEHLELEVNSKREVPDFESWEKLIEQAKSHFTTSSLQKIVLFRKSIFEIDTCSPLEVLSYLFANSAHYKNRASIAFMPRKDLLFFSMSPEKLFSAKGTEIICDLVAGTAKKKELLSSKEHLENDFVLLDLRKELKKCTFKSLETTPIEIIPSGNLFHLHRKLKVEFERTPDYLKLASLLHPTAAILGFPRKESLKVLSGIEPCSRDLYAGYMGLVTKDTADLFVTIRSALIEKEIISLFAGAGIVSLSDPQKEWDELDLKIDPYLKTLFGESLSCKLNSSSAL